MMDSTTELLIANSMSAVRYRLIKCLDDEQVTPDNLAQQYIDFVLKYAGVTNDDIKELKDSAFQLADLIDCEVKSNFQITVSYR